MSENFEEAFSLYDTLPVNKINSKKYNQLVREYGKKNGNEAALTQIKKMVERGIDVEIATHDFGVLYHLENNQTDDAYAYFTFIRSLGKLPDNRIYNLVIAQYCSFGRLSNAVQLLVCFSLSYFFFLHFSPLVTSFLHFPRFLQLSRFLIFFLGLVKFV